MHRHVVGATLVGLGLCSLAGVGCSLILDFDDPPAPPDAVPIDAINATACDFGEVNDTRETATALAMGTTENAGICSEGDRDFYAIAVGTGQTLTVDVTFTQDGSKGDLDMLILDSQGATRGRSLSTDDDEGIVCPGTSPSCPQLPPGNYVIEIFGFNDTTVNGYSIEYTVEGGTPIDAGI